MYLMFQKHSKEPKYSNYISGQVILESLIKAWKYYFLHTLNVTLDSLCLMKPQYQGLGAQTS